MYTQIFVLRRDTNHEMDPNRRVAFEEARYAAEARLHTHRHRAMLSRQQYYYRRAKAATEENLKRGYLSMVIDGAGAQASNYCPRFKKAEKGEPERHMMMKIKSTYIKVCYLSSVLTIF